MMYKENMFDENGRSINIDVIDENGKPIYIYQLPEEMRNVAYNILRDFARFRYQFQEIAFRNTAVEATIPLTIQLKMSDLDRYRLLCKDIIADDVGIGKNMNEAYCSNLDRLLKDVQGL